MHCNSVITIFKDIHFRLNWFYLNYFLPIFMQIHDKKSCRMKKIVKFNLNIKIICVEIRLIFRQLYATRVNFLYMLKLYIQIYQNTLSIGIGLLCTFYANFQYFAYLSSLVYIETDVISWNCRYSILFISYSNIYIKAI